MTKNQWLKLFSALAFASLCAGLLLMASGCASVDFRKKAVAVEGKVYGLDVEIPSTNAGESVARIRLGVVTSRYISAPEGGEAKIETEHEDVNIWTLSGSAKSKLSVENPAKD